MYSRIFQKEVVRRIQEKRRFIQVLAGPRQVGKTTLTFEALKKNSFPSHYATADAATLRDRVWIEQQWEIARKLTSSRQTAVLVLDEIQKIPQWSEVVKLLWDEDSLNKKNLKVLLLGSSPLLLQKGLSESLAGRFETIQIPHWSYLEMKEAFRQKLEEFLFFGAYPGSASLIKNENRWRQYILDSLVETTISRDILLMTRVDKPALLRRLFQLGCEYSGQILSYQKMVGQLQDVGNTVTLAYYLELLSGAGLLTGLQKFSINKIKKRNSSPKLITLNTALMNATSEENFDSAKNNPEYWGRLLETAVGAHLYNQSMGKPIEIFYWREANHEVDFVVKKGKKIMAIEVKSHRIKTSLPGLTAFEKKFGKTSKLLVGGEGMVLEEFFLRDIETLV